MHICFYRDAYMSGCYKKKYLFWCTGIDGNFCVISTKPAEIAVSWGATDRIGCLHVWPCMTSHQLSGIRWCQVFLLRTWGTWGRWGRWGRWLREGGRNIPYSVALGFLSDLSHSNFQQANHSFTGMDMETSCVTNQVRRWVFFWQYCIHKPWLFRVVTIQPT
jgi:hypothetical protein